MVQESRGMFSSDEQQPLVAWYFHRLPHILSSVCDYILCCGRVSSPLSNLTPYITGFSVLVVRLHPKGAGIYGSITVVGGVCRSTG